MTGLYVSLAPDGKIKRHLSTEKGEIPLSDTNICDELISLTDIKSWRLYGFTKTAMCLHFNHLSDQGGFPSLYDLADRYLSKREPFHPMYTLLTRTHIADSIHNRKNKRIAADKIRNSVINRYVRLYCPVDNHLNSMCHICIVVNTPKRKPGKNYLLLPGLSIPYIAAFQWITVL